MQDFEKFYNWLTSYDYESIPSNIEKEVETKFVIPLFQHLGYPDTNRRQEFYVHFSRENISTNSGRADFVYFSESDPKLQDAESSLVLVEAKKLQEESLSDASKRITEYGESLKAPFLFITNGYFIKLLRRKPFHKDELIFENTILTLKDREEAKKFYSLLNFPIVERIKIALADPLRHEDHVLAASALERFPDIKQYIQDGYFESVNERTVQKQRVARDTVSITCKFPRVLEGGQCDIVLKRTLPPGMLFKLNHKEILTSLLIGLKTDYHLNLRGFLKVDSDNNLAVKLGNTTFNVSEKEADDLCYCVDCIFVEYRKIMEATEDALQTWNFPRLEVEWPEGFQLLTIPKSLWELMHDFAGKFDYGKGKTQWHIFQWNGVGIIVFPENIITVQFFPYIDTFNISNSDDVKVIYKPYISSRHEENWHNWVGVNGVWDAEYAKEWLLNDLIPTVINYHSNKISLLRLQSDFNLSWKTICSSLISKSRRKQTVQDALTKYIIDYGIIFDCTPLTQVQKPTQLESYIRDIGHFRGSGRIPANLVLSYYKEFLKFSTYANPKSESYRYIDSKLHGCRCYPHRKDLDGTSGEYRVLVNSFKEVRNRIEIQIDKVKSSGYETHDELDMMCRVFVTIIKQDFRFQQENLNTFKDAIKKIWLEARFDRRYQDIFYVREK